MYSLLLSPVGVVALLVVSGGFYMLDVFESKLPNHLVPKSADSTTSRICMAYESLFFIDKNYHTSPPNIYTLIEVPQSTAVRGKLVTGLQKKTEGLYKDLNRVKDSARDVTKAQIAAWNRVGEVLLGDRTRQVYNWDFAGQNTQSQLNRVWGERWKEMKKGD